MSLTDTSERANLQPDLLEVEDLESNTLVELFASKGWGDGLPLVAPTVERVETMLAAVDTDPDELLGTIPPRHGALTPRTVAVNAVLAGCAPTVMPVLVEVARALGSGVVDLAAINPTTHPVAPLVIVHGEAVERLGFNAGAGSFGPGCRANATVGRTVRLLMIHAGGAVPGDGDRSTQGQPSKYTFCVAENTAASPWGGYPASVGVDAPSAVTVAGLENPTNIHDMESDRPERILDKIASNITSLGSNHACLSGAEIFIALGPEHAATIAGQKWRRDDVQGYLFQRARLPARTIRAAFDNRREPHWTRGLGDDELVPMTDHPDKFRIFVTGGPGKHSQVLPSFGARPTSVTRPLYLPDDK
ncbi:MAG TPA: hypothetical protein VHC18_11780 [Amycolatopsis sp.]|nr:hypothetical protein [Amycolatopsis sp.]